MRMPGKVIGIFTRTVMGLSLAVVFTAGFIILPAKAKKIFPGPYKAIILKIIDADTIKVKLHIFPQHFIETNIRIRDIDTPEIRRPKCEAEKQKGLHATIYVKRLLPRGMQVLIRHISFDKYGGRYLGALSFKKRKGGIGDLSRRLIKLNHAKAYDGGRKPSWC